MNSQIWISQIEHNLLKFTLKIFLLSNKLFWHSMMICELKTFPWKIEINRSICEKFLPKNM